MVNNKNIKLQNEIEKNKRYKVSVTLDFINLVL